MRIMPRFLFCALLLVLPFAVHGAKPEKKALPAAPAVPAQLDAVTFTIHTDSETRKLVVISSPQALRVDALDEGYSVIFNPKTEHYIGLEHRNYTWWEFSWPEVHGALSSTKRYQTHLQEITAEGAAPFAGGADPAKGIQPDSAGYVWSQTPQKKEVNGLPCVRWSGESPSGDKIEAWCYEGVLPKVRGAMEQLQKINDPMALVPIRTLVPTAVLPAWGALIRGGVTPILIIWGAENDRNRFGVTEVKVRPGKADLFVVPKLYLKTTLISMDGIVEQKK